MQLISTKNFKLTFNNGTVIRFCVLISSCITMQIRRVKLNLSTSMFYTTRLKPHYLKGCYSKNPLQSIKSLGKILSTEQQHEIEAVVKSGVIPCIISLLDENSANFKLKKECLLIIFHLIPEQSTYLIDNGILKILINVLFGSSCIINLQTVLYIFARFAVSENFKNKSQILLRKISNLIQSKIRNFTNKRKYLLIAISNICKTLLTEHSYDHLVTDQSIIYIMNSVFAVNLYALFQSIFVPHIMKSVNNDSMNDCVLNPCVSIILHNYSKLSKSIVDNGGVLIFVNKLIGDCSNKQSLQTIIHILERILTDNSHTIIWFKQRTVRELLNCLWHKIEKNKDKQKLLVAIRNINKYLIIHYPMICLISINKTVKT
eukprot:255403_1